jgi:hypothetical protein
MFKRTMFKDLLHAARRFIESIMDAQGSTTQRTSNSDVGMTFAFLLQNLLLRTGLVDSQE